MIRAARLCAGAAVLLATACAHDGRMANVAARGEPVGVNSVPAVMPEDQKSVPVTGVPGTGIDPSPSAMATTTATGR